ncbi:uncharacterized protein BO66DRAFT_388422 [Aspergillus aculeatinus CBS 121060]|uniref:Uncharacterized protein n=1 Tax=Aspergillus aculeatinus CBS 121060 TaxID=1448322 RepID=A0ACD1HKH6_9EURO|nr:hypothetical protein BO66DRAFT_388422 [Aspergillus aculeatinus CBS 121060]RAH74364.1 hypothetical protein BO66DRAFT_388422 [Aspergillus aculeatinus CBS 121060]
MVLSCLPTCLLACLPACLLHQYRTPVCDAAPLSFPSPPSPLRFAPPSFAASYNTPLIPPSSILLFYSLFIHHQHQPLSHQSSSTSRILSSYQKTPLTKTTT